MRNETKVYVAKASALADNALFQKLYQEASAERRAKTDAFLFQKDKRLCLAAEFLLRRGLADAGIRRYQLGYGPNGKPYVIGEDVCFNLSHSEENVMCAVSGKEVGCDVEKVARIDLEIARRFFYANEYERIAGEKNLSRRYETFFRLWTLKESFLKATGLGMSLPLDAFQIEMQGRDISVRQTVSRQAWHFKEYDFKDGYKYAVCGLMPHFAKAEFVSFQI